MSERKRAKMNLTEEENVVDLGVTQTLARFWFGRNATHFKTIVISIIINITISNISIYTIG